MPTIAKLTSPKNLRLFHFSIFLSEIFRIGAELPHDLIWREGGKNDKVMEKLLFSR